MLKSTRIFLILSLFLSTIGCTGIDFITPIVTGVVMWQEGEAHKYYEYNADTIFRASKRALEKMNLEVKEAEQDGTDYSMIGGNNNKFSIKISQIEPEITKLSLRINFMGDKNYAELFYKHVDEEVYTIRFDNNGRPMRKRL